MDQDTGMDLFLRWFYRAMETTNQAYRDYEGTHVYRVSLTIEEETSEGKHPAVEIVICDSRRDIRTLALGFLRTMVLGQG